MKEEVIVKGLSIDKVLFERVFSRPFNGRIISVFSDTFNILTSKKQLISLTTKEFDGPNIIRLPQDFIEKIRELEVNRRVKGDKNEIFLIDDKIRIDLSDIKKWEIKTELPEKLDLNKLRSNIFYIEKLIKNLKVKLKEKKIYELLEIRVWELIKMLKEQDKTQIKIKILQIIGLGIGLTPSGDDIILSFLFVFQLLKKMKKIDAELFLIALEEIMHLVKKKTTLISYEYIKAGLENRFSEDIFNFGYSIFFEDKNQIEERLRVIMRYGETSGYDFTYGFLKAIDFFFSQNYEA